MKSSPHSLLFLSTLTVISLCLPLTGRSQASEAQDGSTRVHLQIDWEKFLSHHDLRWDRLPPRWEEGAFLGNGLLGLMIYGQEGASLRFDVGRSDVTDHRAGDTDPLVNRARLPIGSFYLTPVGHITGSTMRLDLWNAEASGVLTTDNGSIEWSAWVHAQDKVMVVELHPSDGEKACRFEWAAAVSATTRPRNKGLPANYRPNSPSTTEKQGAAQVCVQPLLQGGQYATAWEEDTTARGSRLIYASVGASWPKTTSCDEALGSVEKARQAGIAALKESHRAWWHQYYPQSFLSIPDARLESFYWIQMYKLASATRADRPALDLMGPWFRKTIWPGIWWNLNIQLAYSPVYTANRLEMGESLCRLLDDHVSNLCENVKYIKGYDFKNDSACVPRVTGPDMAGGMFKGQQGAPEVGDLAWACHNYWRQCRYAGDDERLASKLLPLLRRAMHFYGHMMTKGEDGKYHLPATYSPEFGKTVDCNYDLSLFRWGCQALVESDERLRLNDPDLPLWKDVLSHLTEFPADANGFRIGRELSFDHSHRHYSHLLMVYPLYVIHDDQPEYRDIIHHSVEQWTQKAGAFAGFSYAGAASMDAMPGRGNEAANFMNEFVNRLLEPNTMYLEADSPVIESPLAGAQSLQDMLLQSWGGTIHVFPGVPESWKEAAFHNLRAEGAFLVSAVRAEGRTRWVRIKSLAGEPCRVKVALNGEVRATAPMKVLADGLYQLELHQGEEALLYGDGAAVPPTCEVAPLPGDSTAWNYFGSRAAASTAKKKKH